jgi:hypothetical protein
VSPQARAAAIRALGDHPLAEEPFLLSAVAAIADGDTRRGEALLLEAKRRNPRSRMARLLLLDRFLRTDRPAEAAAELGTLTVLVPRTAEVTNPKTAGTLKSALQNHPGLLNSVLSRLASTGASPDTILALAASGGPSPPGADTQWQAILVDSLARQGDVARAYRLWREFGKVNAPADGKGLYDPGFQGMPGLAPFNWALVSNTAGVAERAAGGGLQVSFYGRLDVQLAEQLLMLKPGRYRMQFRAEGDAKGESSKIGWTLSCHGSKATLVQLPLTNITYAPRLLAASFTVPAAGCGAQWLRLSGAAAEFPDEQAATIRDLQIAPEAS